MFSIIASGRIHEANTVKRNRMQTKPTISYLWALIHNANNIPLTIDGNLDTTLKMNDC